MIYAAGIKLPAVFLGLLQNDIRQEGRLVVNNNGACLNYMPHCKPVKALHRYNEVSGHIDSGIH